MQHCIDNNVKYCFMFDDGITDVYSLNAKQYDYKRSISDILKQVKAKLKILKTETGLPICCYTFFREGNRFLGVDKHDCYFSSLPLQAVLLDIEVLKEHHVNYEDMNVCGLEDVAFFMDAVKEGLVFYGDQWICIDGKLPNVIVKGGSHEDTDIERFVKHRDIGHRKLMEYVGNCYGIMLTKKWRQSLGFALTYARIDFGYFREVLVFHRKENEEIIKNKFKIA